MISNTNVYILLIISISIRVIGAFIQSRDKLIWYRIIYSILCVASAWTWASAFQAYSPIWPILIIAAIIIFIEQYTKLRYLHFIADIIYVFALGFLSIPQLTLIILIESALLFGAIGFIADEVAFWILKKVKHRFFVPLILLCCILLVFPIIRKPVLKISRTLISIRSLLLPYGFLFVGIFPIHEKEAIRIDDRTVAWVGYTPRKEKYFGAITFHGANTEGSMQPASLILRRALAQAGFLALSVDHPGYGKSLNPKVDKSIESWDPLPVMLKAYDRLKKIAKTDIIIECGHSMGTTDALRLLSAGVKLDKVILFGAASQDPAKRIYNQQRENYWNLRFIKNRKIQDNISLNKIFEIRHRFYDDWNYIKLLRPDHPEIIFVKFGKEWPNIAAMRDTLYDAIPGKKESWTLSDSTHYFSSFEMTGNIIIGDTRVARRLFNKLNSVYEQIKNKR